MLSFLQAAPYTILTITPEPTSLTDSFSLIKVLKRLKFDHPIFVLVNMAPNQGSAKDTYKRFGDAVATYLQIKVHYLGYILSDKDLTSSVLQQKAVILESPSGLASRCILTISERLERALESAKKTDSFSGFWAKLLLPCGDSSGESQKNETLPLAETGPPEKGNDFASIKQLLQKIEMTEKEAEGLLGELIQIWMERFGQPPPPLLGTVEESVPQNNITTPEPCTKELKGIEKQATATPEEREPLNIQEAEVAGLRRAIHYARLLARSEQKQ